MAVLAATLLVACHAATPPSLVARVEPSEAEGQIAAVDTALRSARYALEPPRTRLQTREAAAVPRMEREAVLPEWVMLQIATMQDVAGNAAVPPSQRADANVLAARGEGLLIQHFTTLFWNKAEPGKRVIGYLQAALEQDPHDEPAAVAYTLSLFGVRNSGFRSQAEDMVGVKTAPELARVAGLLAEHDDSLLAQSLVLEVLTALRTDGPLPTELASLAEGRAERIAALRAQDPDQAEDVDDRLQHYAD